ncbi:MAG: Na(+)-translocating NADH-quinone reductase subunit C [Calditrichaeota bacterium]|nr:MAG: Na(+)-translocating NADH-quinone reductase subunit C [Calditrichota bacterium]
MSSNESTKKVLFVALGVCLVCSILVSAATVSLRSRQERNKELDKVKNILAAGELLDEQQDVVKIFHEKIKMVVVDLSNGQILQQENFPKGLDAENFNIKEVADNSQLGMDIPDEHDLARINRMPRYMAVYEVMEFGSIEKVILPIYGKGLWSTLYGFLALGKDLNTVEGITFYEHGETPGLGGEVDNPNWKALWKGKMAFDDAGNVALTVIKGKVDPSEEKARHQIDGLSGSTLTTRGLDAMVKFWLGDQGYGAFLKQLKKDNTHEQG